MQIRAVWLSVVIVFAIAVFSIYKHFYFGNRILLGQTCAISGPAGIFGQDARDGAMLYFDYINENGGVKGKKIELITLDDKYEPETAQKNSEILLNKGVFAFFGVVGTPTALTSLSVARQNDKLFLTPFTGASFLRNNTEYVVNMRSGYEQEAQALIDYLAGTKKLSRIAILYQNDAFGADGSWSVKKALQKFSLKECASYAFNRNTLSLEYAVSELQRSKPEAVVIIGSYQPCAEFILEFKKAGLNQCMFGALSFVHSQQLKKTLGSNCSNVIVSEVVPEYMDDSFAASILYRKLFYAKYHNRAFSSVSFEGFLSAMYVAKAFAKSSSLLSNNSVLNGFEQIDDIGGLKLFGANGQKSLNPVYLNFLDKK